MSIFSLFKDTLFESSHNGILTLRKYWHGGWFLKIADGEFYSSTYLEKMWFFVFKYYRKRMLPKNVLILGSGGGCATQIIKKMWPTANIDALDYDQGIMAVSKEIYNFDLPNIHFIVEEAYMFISSCSKKYDFIIIDLFQGNHPLFSLLKNKDFIHHTKRILNKPGLVVINIASKLGGEDKKAPVAWQRKFLDTRIVNYAQNSLLIIEESNIPDDYYSIFQDPSHATMLGRQGVLVIGTPHSQLVLKPLPFKLCVVNAIHTDNEPQIKQIQRLGYKHGLIFWSTWRKKSIPPGWKKSLLVIHQKGNGLSHVKTDYRTGWSQMARRNLKKFQKNEITIESVAPVAFIDGLQHATLPKSLQKGFSKMIEDTNRDITHCWLAKESEKILGGLATVNYSHISAHHVAFLTKDGEKKYVGVGLIDHWYQYALSENMKYLNFGHIWEQGEPLSWRGYSNFKKKFIDEEIILNNGFFTFF